jgi:hypothetical protein
LDPFIDKQPIPQQVSAFGKIRLIAIAAGAEHTMVIEEGTGQIWLWGWDIGYCLGVDYHPDPPPPHPHDHNRRVPFSYCSGCPKGERTAPSLSG